MSIEQIPVGKEFVTEGRTISEGEFTVLQSLLWVTKPMHANKEYMKNTPFGERIMLGALLVALMFGVEEQVALWNEIEKAGFQGRGLLGIDKIRFKTPFMPGDTLIVHARITDVHRSSNPKRVVVARKVEGYNQKNELLAEYIATALVEET